MALFRTRDIPERYLSLTERPLLFQPESIQRESGRVLISGGEVTRNRDYFSGKPYRINPMGIRTHVWQKQGGILLYMHNYNISLGRATVYHEMGKLWADDSFDFHRKVVPVATQNWIGDAIGEVNTAVIADMWEEGYLNAVSIGIMFTPDDIANIEETDDEIYFGSSEMLEFSIVTLAADRDAHRQDVQQQRQYQFMLNSGVPENTAACLTCYSAPANNVITPEANMDENEDIVEDVELEEEEGVLEEQVEEEAVGEFLINPSELIQAASENEAFMTSLAMAIVNSPVFSSTVSTAVAEAVAEQRRSQPIRLRFETQTPRTAPARQPVPAKQPVKKAAKAPVPANGSLRLLGGK